MYHSHNFETVLPALAPVLVPVLVLHESLVYLLTRGVPVLVHTKITSAAADKSKDVGESISMKHVIPNISVRE